MKNIIRNNYTFFIPYLLFLCAGGAILILWTKPEIHLFINRNNCPFADFFFRYWSDLGLGLTIIPVAIILAFIRLRYMLISVLGFAISGSINDTLKVIFHTPRPFTFFNQINQPLHLVPDVQMLSWNSFPSGHSATGFCMFCLLAFYSKNNFLKFVSFVVALLIAYSRMYLSQHFLQDVYAGSLIGVLSAVTCYLWVMNGRFFNKFSERLDKPLISFSKN